jgi:hypothetical protein
MALIHGASAGDLGTTRTNVDVALPIEDKVGQPSRRRRSRRQGRLCRASHRPDPKSELSQAAMLSNHGGACAHATCSLHKSGAGCPHRVNLALYRSPQMVRFTPNTHRDSGHPG